VVIISLLGHHQTTTVNGHFQLKTNKSHKRAKNQMHLISGRAGFK